MLNPKVNFKYPSYKCKVVFDLFVVVKLFPSDLMVLGSFTVCLCDWDRANHRWRMETLRKLLIMTI